MTLTPTDINQTLDDRDLHDAARAPGCYALRLDTPDSVEGVARAWLASSDAPLPTGWDAALARSRVAYVGASKDVYHRLCVHAEGDKHKARFVGAFDPVDVVDVWPEDGPFQAERNRALSLARDGWTVAVNGEVLTR